MNKTINLLLEIFGKYSLMKGMIDICVISNGKCVCVFFFCCCFVFLLKINGCNAPWRSVDAI